MDNDKPFENDFGKIMYPGDPSAAGANIYNCRCTLIADIEGFENNLSDLSLRNTNKLGDMSYEEWKAEKEFTSDPITKQDEIERNMRRAYANDYKRLVNLQSAELNGVQESKTYLSNLGKREGAIRELDYEKAYLLDRNGKTIFSETQYNPKGVKFTAEQRRKMKNNVLTHNHPLGSTLSGQDVVLMTETDMYQIRATGVRDGKTITYHLKKKRGQTQDINIAKEYSAFEKLVFAENDDKYNAEIKKYKLTDREKHDKMCKELDDIANNRRREWLKENASKYGYTYGEKRKK